MSLTAITAISSCEEDTVDGGPAPDVRAIVNGSPTNWKSWTGVVGVIPKFANTDLPLMMCTGTLIQPNIVITAGHCVFYEGQSALESFDLREKPGRILIKGSANLGMGVGGFTVGKPVEVVAHPSWIGRVEVGSIDLALIKLEKPVSDLPWYCLRRETMVQVGDPGVVVGYGSTSIAAQLSTGIHRSGEATVQSVLDRIFEVGDPSSTCQGDSGGPFFSLENGEYRLTGVTSFGTKDQCSAVDDSWEVNLLTYLDWVDSELERLTGGAANRDCTGTGPLHDSDAALEDSDTAEEADSSFDSENEAESEAESETETDATSTAGDGSDENSSSGSCSATPTQLRRQSSLLRALLGQHMQKPKPRRPR